jgi:hypothetical protein
MAFLAAQATSPEEVTAIISGEDGARINQQRILFGWGIRKFF